MTTKFHPLLTAILISTAFCQCTKDRNGDEVELEGDTDEDSDSPPTNVAATPPAPYTALSFATTDLEQDSPTHSPGFQAKLLRAANGTLYVVHFKYDTINPTGCNIAAFSGGPAPDIRYYARLAIKPSGGNWSSETIPIQNAGGPSLDHVGALLGLDAFIANNGDLVVALNAGGPGLFTCASSDLIIGTRNSGSGAWTFNIAASASTDCCAGEQNTGGFNVGAWPAMTKTSGSAYAVAYTDHHNTTDQDGGNNQSFELWQSNGTRALVEDYNSYGSFPALIYLPNGQLYSAYSAYAGSGLRVSRRTASAGTPADWQKSDTLRPNVKIGERISMALAPNGVTVGIAAQITHDASNRQVDDLIYCKGTYNPGSGEVTFDLPPCENIDEPQKHVGYTPSLAFDSQNRPMIAYYTCGSSTSCLSGGDGARLAWRDAATNTWLHFNVHFNAAAKSGLYTSLAVEPGTNQPLIVSQDLTRGALMISQGTLSQ